MTTGKYLTGGAWAALAAALVLGATPAAARERENMGRTVGEPSAARGEARPARAERQAPREFPRAMPQRDVPRATPPVRQSAPAPAVRQGGDRADAGQRGGRDWNRSGNDGNRGGRDWNRTGGNADASRAGRDWNRSDNDASRGDRQADAGRRGNGGWSRGSDTNGTVATTTDRNRSYTDRDRNRSYDGRRDGDRNWGGRDRRDNDRNWGDRNGGYRDGNRTAGRDYRRWDHRSWRNDRRYDWNRYRSANRNVFRLGVYYSPYRNYSYRRLNIGWFLDSLFYSNRYWINDPWRYRLPEVYGPYRWVRYYDDVLLVDIYNGEVVDVIYDFFW